MLSELLLSGPVLFPVFAKAASGSEGQSLPPSWVSTRQPWVKDTPVGKAWTGQPVPVPLRTAPSGFCTQRKRLLWPDSICRDGVTSSSSVLVSALSFWQGRILVPSLYHCINFNLLCRVHLRSQPSAAVLQRRGGLGYFSSLPCLGSVLLVKMSVLGFPYSGTS